MLLSLSFVNEDIEARGSVKLPEVIRLGRSGNHIHPRLDPDLISEPLPFTMSHPVLTLSQHSDPGQSLSQMLYMGTITPASLDMSRLTKMTICQKPVDADKCLFVPSFLLGGTSGQ